MPFKSNKQNFKIYKEEEYELAKKKNIFLQK